MIVTPPLGRRGTPPTRAPRAWSRSTPALVALAFIAGGLWAACAGSERVVAYSGVAAACEAAEQRIEDREGSTLAEDTRDLRTIRLLCDEIMARVEGGSDAE